MDRELYHTALGALYYGYKRIYGDDVKVTECERIFEEMLIELDKRGLEIVRKK